MMIKDMIPLLGIEDVEPPWDGEPIAIRATLQGEQSQNVHILEIEGKLAFVKAIDISPWKINGLLWIGLPIRLFVTSRC